MPVRPAQAFEQEPAGDRADDDRRHDRDLVRHVRHAEHDVREERGRNDGQRRARTHDREEEREARDDDERRELQPVVRVDLRVEAAQRPDRMRRRCRRERPAQMAERGRCDVDDRDEPRDLRRLRDEQPVEAAAEDGDVIPVVVRDRRALRRKRDDDDARATRRSGRSARRQEDRALRDAAEVRVHLPPAHELRERLPAVRRRAGAGDEEADGAVPREVAQLPPGDVVEDDDAERRRPGHRLRLGRDRDCERDEHEDRKKEYARPPEHRPPRFSLMRGVGCRDDVTRSR